MIVYLNGKYIPVEEARISPFDRGFMFADGLYEVIMIYNNKLFLLNEHFERLQRNLKSFYFNYDVENLKEICNKILELNEDKKDVYIYIQITRGVSFPRKHIYKDVTEPTVFVTLMKYKKLYNPADKSLITVFLFNDYRWGRCDVKAISLQPAVLGKQLSVNRGGAEAFWHRDGILLEGMHSNLFMVKNKILITPISDKRILTGITRNLVLKIAAKKGIEIQERDIRKEEIFLADEVFITSTTNEITPVGYVEGKIINGGEIGEITKTLINGYREEVNEFINK